MATHHHTVSAAQSGQKLRQILKTLTGLSSKNVNGLIDNGQVQVNQKTERYGSTSLKVGQKIIWHDNNEEQKSKDKPKLSASLGDPQRVFDNDELLVICKPPGIPSQRTRDAKRLNAEDWVQQWGKKQGYGRLILTHRLDRDTSGLLLFGKGERAATRCTEWFKHRQIQKTYLALCHGQAPNKPGQWEQFLGKGPIIGGRQAFAVVRSGGQKARTSYRILGSQKRYSLWQLQPHTGRTHQLRVQLAHAGHPIVGDDLYGDRRAQSEAPHHLLHAGGLKLPEESGVEQELLAPLPPDFAAFLKSTGLQQKLPPNFA